METHYLAIIRHKAQQNNCSKKNLFCILDIQMCTLDHFLHNSIHTELVYVVWFTPPPSPSKFRLHLSTSSFHPSVCVCVCVYIYIYTHTHIYTYPYTHIYIYVSQYMTSSDIKYRHPTGFGAPLWATHYAQSVFQQHQTHVPVYQSFSLQDYSCYVPIFENKTNNNYNNRRNVQHCSNPTMALIFTKLCSKH